MKTQNDGGPKELKTEDGFTIFISAEDYPLISQHKWRIGTNGYVYLVGGRKCGTTCLIHRMIMSAISGDEIHHRDENKLNNTRSNLEVLCASSHQDKHKHKLIARNRANRKYSDTGICKRCGQTFTKHPSHRGRQVCCSKLCGALLAAQKHSEKG